jgi:hypothetical protein
MTMIVPMVRWFPRLNIAPEQEILAGVPEGLEIPRIIHQTFRSRLLPREIEKNIEKIKRMNPQWEYRFYDDNDVLDFIRSNYDSRVLDYFNRIDPLYGASRSDLFRYLLMYKCGGVYIDIKSSFNKPLSDVLVKSDQYLLSNWRNRKGESFEGAGMHNELKDIKNGEFQQWHIVAAPGHPFLKAVIENVFRNIDTYSPILHGVGRMGVLRVSGPIAYTLAIAPWLHLQKYRLVDSQFDLGFEYSIFRGSKLDAHKSLFKLHYSVLREPVIRKEGRSGVSIFIIKNYSRVRDRIRRAGFEIGGSASGGMDKRK